MRRLAILISLALAVCLAVIARGDVIEHGNFRVEVDATISPKNLPRSGVAPVRFALSVRFISNQGSTPPQLRQINIEINRHGHIDPDGLPLCRMEQVQPATTANALAACRRSFIGEGSFHARVLFTQQAPFPSNGKLIAFNGRWRGHPAILAHIYGPRPVPTSYTIPFMVRSRGKGTFGSELSASLPDFSPKWGHVTAISLTLGRRFTYRGRRRSYISAGCPAPPGIPLVTYPLTHTTLSFAGRQTVNPTIRQSCGAR